jgi:hypothetical protein
MPAVPRRPYPAPFRSSVAVIRRLPFLLLLAACPPGSGRALAPFNAPQQPGYLAIAPGNNGPGPN